MSKPVKLSNCPWRLHQKSGPPQVCAVADGEHVHDGGKRTHRSAHGIAWYESDEGAYQVSTFLPADVERSLPSDTVGGGSYGPCPWHLVIDRPGRSPLYTQCELRGPYEHGTAAAGSERSAPVHMNGGREWTETGSGAFVAGPGWSPPGTRHPVTEAQAAGVQQKLRDLDPVGEWYPIGSLPLAGDDGGFDRLVLESSARQAVADVYDRLCAASERAHRAELELAEIRGQLALALVELPDGSDGSPASRAISAARGRLHDILDREHAETATVDASTP